MDYSSILKTDRVQAGSASAGTILAESENDRSNLLFSPIFQHLQHQGHVFPLLGERNARTKLAWALQCAQIGRDITRRIGEWLQQAELATATQCAAVINFIETACLARDIGEPPFGQTGSSAIQRWFSDHGSTKIKAACKTYSGRELDASDPRVLNALADFYEFDAHPQGLRALAKFRWETDPRGLNMTKTSLACYLQSIRIAEAKAPDASEGVNGPPGFFSTEAGLVKDIWSTFGYAGAPQRFPLTYIVAAADDIASALGGIEDAIACGFLRQRDAIQFIKNDWLSSYVPANPNPVDEKILESLTNATEGTDHTGKEYAFADFRRALIDVMSGYASNSYRDHHQAVCNGALDTLLPPESGPGAMLTTLRKYCRQYVYRHEHVQRHELVGYQVVTGLLEHFGILLECSHERLQAALDFSGIHDAQGKSLIIEKKLLALIPDEHFRAYSHLVAQLGNAGGRDVEFEEWNARAHMLLDFLTGLTDSAAMSLWQTLSGKII